MAGSQEPGYITPLSPSPPPSNRRDLILAEGESLGLSILFVYTYGSRSWPRGFSKPVMAVEYFRLAYRRWRIDDGAST